MQNESTTAARITIKVNEEGEFTYEPSVKRLREGQPITWACSQGPFCISFQQGTPFDSMDFHGDEGPDGWTATSSEADVAGEAGHFHYAVAIFWQGRVYMDAGCPEIIVN